MSAGGFYHFMEELIQISECWYRKSAWKNFDCSYLPVNLLQESSRALSFKFPKIVFNTLKMRIIPFWLHAMSCTGFLPSSC